VALLGERLFGSRTRTRVILGLAGLGETYPRDLAKLLDVPLMTVQRIMADLEDQGLVVSRKRGTIRLTSFAERSPIFIELITLLYSLLEEDPDLTARLSKLRRRPRAPGKAI
jgi:Mn-dependent DtxR family transcriptional regulator